MSDFCWSWAEAPDELEDGELLVSLEPEVDPLPAVPLDEELGVDEDAPPLDWLFSSELVADELEDGEELGEALDGEEPDMDPDAEPDDDPDGEDGVVAPLEDEEPDGELEGLVVEDDDEPVADLSPARSQAVSIVAPSAMETAIASVDNLMWPPWLGLLWG